MAERKPAPEIKHPYVFSVSQAETFMLCPRKWAYLKIDGLEDPGNEASQLGGAVHSELEDYLEKGVPINARKRAGQIAMCGVPHLPPPMYPGMEIEAWFKIKIGNYKGKYGVGAYYRGLIDVQIRGGWKSKRPFVSDHKTTKNFMWKKDAAYLTEEDIQAGLYGYVVMVETGWAEVDIQWTYMRTTGPPVADPTVAILYRDQALKVIHKLELVTAEMIRTKDENPTAETVVQDFNGCDAFGGCPFKYKCKPTPQQKLRAMMSQIKTEENVMTKEKTGSVLGRLAARKAEKKGGDATTASTPKEASKTTEVKEEVKAESKKESTTSAVNPPENAEAPEVTEEDAKNRSKRTSRSNKTSTTTPKTKSHSEPTESSLLGRLLDVVIDEIAARVEERIKK